jgi:homoserine kinase type II
MGTFRTLSADQVRARLDAFGLGGYRAHTPISAGTINTNLAVDTATGRYFLRVNEGKTRDEVEREAAIVAHVAARGVPTPPPVRARDGLPFVAWGDVFVSLFPWVDGRVLGRRDLEPRHARDAGRALAKLHRAGADFADHRAGRYEPDEIRRRFGRIAAQADDDPALRDAVATLGPELATLERERRPDLPTGVIHGDLFIDNVLYATDGSLAALLDFEQASWGRLAYDAAVSLLAFGFGQDDFRDDVTVAFIEGYVAERPPTADERAAFGAELRFAACRFTVTRITDVYLRRGAGAPSGKDFSRYLLRLRRVRERLERGDRTLAL